jgi:hypothetical protein
MAHYDTEELLSARLDMPTNKREDCNDDEAMIEKSVYLSLAVRAHLLLGAPHAHAIRMEEVLAAEPDARVACFELLATDGAASSKEKYSY